MMMRLEFALFVGLLVRQTDSFRLIDGVGRSSLSIQSRQLRNWGIIFALDDADVSLEGEFGSTMNDETGESATSLTPLTPQPKKKAPKRKPKASAPVTAEFNADESASAPAPATPAPAPAPPAPATVPSKIYYRAKEDNEIYAVSSISIDSAVTTLKDLKKLLVDANEWPESSRVIFYNGDERLAFTTGLSECLLDNSSEKPLSVTVLTATGVSEVAATVTNDVPIVQEQQRENFVTEEVNSISLYQGQTTASAPIPTEPFAAGDEPAMVNDINNAELVRNIISPTPQNTFLPGPATGRGAVVDIYSAMPSQSSEWANRLPVETPELRQMQQPSYPPPPPRPSVEETGRFWMNKISLDLGVVLVAKVMKALERSQFLVLAAPGGYGKTSLLQLLERVYEKQGKCVVRFRILQDTDVYHQFQTSSGIDLKNAYIHDLRPNYQKVILIDDAHKVYDTPGFWEVLLKKFPTWCFAWDYTIIFAVTLPVAKGSPIIELLGDPSIPHLGPKDFAPDQ